MIGVVVPVHNEQALLGRCLHALTHATAHPALDGEQVLIVVVLDACTDTSTRIATAHRHVTTLIVNHTNVGRARHAGAEWLLARGARWLAFTDADSRVGYNWLVAQCAANGDAVCGGVRLDGWAGIPLEQRQRYLAHRRTVMNARHVHGANLGVSAAAYRAVGGFAPLRADEDVQLVQALKAHGFTIRWCPELRVLTSARLEARAPRGMATLLKSLQS